jgi:hypothetical protein
VHKLIELVRLAGLETEFENRRRSDADFRTAANVIADWSEEARYRKIEPTVAKAMLEAVLDEDAGFLPWLKTHW